MLDIKKLDKEDKLYIAEYLYSYDRDILIKNDLENLKKVFIKHEIDFDTDCKDASYFYMLTFKQFKDREEDIITIMNQYYSLELNY
jgi:hypothetical protein